MWIDILSYILVGVGVGVLSSFLGFGGGTIIVPFLPLISGLDIKTTIATSLATVALNASNNTFNFHRKNKVRWGLVLTMCIGSMTFGFLSSKIAACYFSFIKNDQSLRQRKTFDRNLMA